MSSTRLPTALRRMHLALAMVFIAGAISFTLWSATTGQVWLGYGLAASIIGGAYLFWFRRKVLAG